MGLLSLCFDLVTCPPSGTVNAHVLLCGPSYVHMHLSWQTYVHMHWHVCTCSHKLSVTSD